MIKMKKNYSDYEQSIELEFTIQKTNPINLINSPVRRWLEEVDFTNSLKEEMKVNICLGTPSQCFNLLIDTSSDNLWVLNKHSNRVPDTPNKFNSINSSSYFNTTLPYEIVGGLGNATGFISKELVNFGDSLQLKTFLLFILVDNKEHDLGELDGVLGLGFNYNKTQYNYEKFSIIFQLKSNKFINNQLFTLKYTSENKGKMTIGNLPNEIINDTKNYGSCPINSGQSQHNTRWECDLHSVFLGNHSNFVNTTVLNSRAVFDTSKNILIGPTMFVKNLEDKYFKDLIKENICSLTENEYYYFYMCSPDDRLNHLPELNFVLGDWILKINSRELFINVSDSYSLFIIFGRNSTDEWVLGLPLLKKFHMVFDHDSDAIGFYGTKDIYKVINPIPDNTNENVDAIWIFIIGFIIILITATFIVIWWLIKKRNRSITLLNEAQTHHECSFYNIENRYDNNIN